MQTVREFPANEEHERTSEQAVCVEARDEHKRSEHHREIPVVYAACSTAAILHNPSLERTEEQDADDVTYRVADRDQDENASVEYPRVVERADHSV